MLQKLRPFKANTTSLFLIFVIFFVNSCKKDSNKNQSIQERIASIKAYYLENNKNNVSYLRSTNGDNILITQEPVWDKVETAELSDHSFVMVFPVETNLFKISGKEGDLILVIVYNKGVKGARLINRFKENNITNQVLTPIDLYKLAFPTPDFSNKSSIYNVLGESMKSPRQTDLKIGKLQSIGKFRDDLIMTVGCIDHYWVTVYQDGSETWEWMYEDCGETRKSLIPVDGGTADVPLDTVMKPSFYQNAKAMCALNKLMQNNFYQRTLNNFIGTNKPIDLTFKLDNIIQEPGYITLGNTAPSPLSWNADNIDLTIASNLIDSLSSIQIALTLLHEGIHAEIYRKLLSIHGPSNLNNQNFPSMFNMYQQYNIDKGFSHEYIANYYVNTIADALKQYDNNKFGIEYYQAYAWSGLKGTDYYTNSLTNVQKIEIDSKVRNLLANRTKQNCNDL